MLENSWFKKEKPFLGLTGMGGGAGGYLVGGGVGDAGVEASGGVIHEFEDSGTKYRAHIFYNPGTFAVTSIPGSHPGNMTYLLVGGGGGGAGDNGGGGGGGGVYSGTSTIGAITYPVTIGLGGKGIWSPSAGYPGLDGLPSSFVDPSGPTTRTAGGGGGGGAYTSGGGQVGLTPGGSGGGASYGNPTGASGNTDAGAQNGGSGTGPGGGGGGAGGTNASAKDGGDGYPNTILGPFIPAPNSYWGGGGGGTLHPGDGSAAGTGGKGGGGGGSDNGPLNGTGGVGLNQGYFGRADAGGAPRSNGGGAGGFATGGGGGGGGSTRSNAVSPQQIGPRNYDPSTAWFTGGGDGGSGICIFRYELDSSYDLTYTKATGGFTHKDDNGDVYHVFTGPTYHGNPGPSLPSGTDFTIGGSPFPATVFLVGGGGGLAGKQPERVASRI